MGQFDAGKLALSLAIYFIIFITGLFIAESFANSYDLDYSVTQSGSTELFGNINGTYQSCNPPRGFLNPQSGTFETIGVFQVDSIKCEYTKGNYDGDVCNVIDGCVYDNDTFLWFNTGTQSCTGIVNLSFYGVVGEVVNIYDDVDNLRSKLNNKEICEIFGFNWGTNSDERDDVSINTFLDLTGSLFTFRASFTDIGILDFILTLLLFYLPLIALIIAIYFSLPFIH